MTWTVELRSVSYSPRGQVETGPVVEWICSGIPTDQPAPHELTADALGERGLSLFADDPAAAVPDRRTRSRQRLGYVTRDPEVLRLALTLANQDSSTEERTEKDRAGRSTSRRVTTGTVHPMVLAAYWIELGCGRAGEMAGETAGAGSSEFSRTVPR